MLKAIDLKINKKDQVEIYTDSGVSLFLDMRKDKKYFEAIGFSELDMTKLKDLSEAGWFRNLFEEREELIKVEDADRELRGSIYEAYLNKTRDAYDAQLQKGKEMGLDEAVQEEPVCRSEKDKLDRRCMQRFQNVWTQSAFQSLSFQAACETSVHDVLATQPFRDSSPPPHRLPEGDPTLKLHAQVPRVEMLLHDLRNINDSK